MFEINRILAQARPAGTAAVTAYTKPAKSLVTIYGIVVCNTTGSAVAYSVYLDADGSTYDQTTALLYDTNINANQSDFISLGATLEVTNGTLGIKTGTGSALTFTILGEVKEQV